jgi:hypothetical protein
MYPEDRVLIAYLPDPSDFDIIKREGWYRIPEKHAPKGLHSEYYAFYFGSRFDEEKWAIHYYARNNGYELVKRRDLIPYQPDHARADESYYRISLGPLQKLEQPITSLRYHRIAFLHTTWDRFQDAREINDLMVQGGEYVDRLYATLRERGIHPEQRIATNQEGELGKEPWVIRCRQRMLEIPQPLLPLTWEEAEDLADAIELRIAESGGLAAE